MFEKKKGFLFEVRSRSTLTRFEILHFYSISSKLTKTVKKIKSLELTLNASECLVSNFSSHYQP